MSKEAGKNEEFVFSPQIEEALCSIGVTAEDLSCLATGSLRWSLEVLPHIGDSASLEVASEVANRKAKANDFVLVISTPDGEWVRRLLVKESQAAAVLRANEFEKATRRRRGSTSELFDPGTIDDWAGVDAEITWERLQHEFRRAAEVVGQMDDVPVYPLVQLWRHHVELSLKLVIVRGHEALGEEGSPENTHSLHRLWNLARPILKTTWLGEWNPREIETVETWILELQAVDPDSQRSRYPTDTSGNAVSPSQKLQDFSPAAFRSKMGRLSALLQRGRSSIDFYNFCRTHNMLHVLDVNPEDNAPRKTDDE